MSGCALLSFVLAGVAIGWVGCAIVGALLLLLVLAELVRQVRNLVSERNDLEVKTADVEELRATRQAARDRVAELEENVATLEQEARSPTLEMEQLLEGIDAHIGLVKTVQKHREINGEVADSPVTRVTSNGDLVYFHGYCSKGGPLLEGELLSVVDADGVSLCVVTGSVEGKNVVGGVQQVYVPSVVLDGLDRGRSFSPSGLVLRPFGLVVEPYSGMTDGRIDSFHQALSGAADQLSEALVDTKASPESNELSTSGEPREPDLLLETDIKVDKEDES